MSHARTTALTGINETVLATLEVAGHVTQSDDNAFVDALGYHDEPTIPAVPFDEILKVDGEADAGVATALASESQLVSPLIFTVDGTEIPSWRILHERTRLERTIDGIVTFTFVVARRSQHDREYEEPLGVIDDFCGAPPGLQSIDVDQIVFTDTDVRRVRLVTNGVVVAAPGVVCSREGEVREFSCADAAGRYLSTTIELVLPPGHGLTREEVVAKVCDELGITDRAITIDDDGPTYKEIQIVDGNGWEFLRTYLAAINCAPAFDRDGVFVVRSVDKPADNSAWSFDTQRLLGQVTDNPSNEGPTTVEVRGNAQIVHDGDGLRTETTIVEVFESYSIKASKFEITDTAGSVGTSGRNDQPFAFQLVRRIVTTRTYEVDTLVFEQVRTYGYRFKQFRVATQVGGTDATTYLYVVNSPLETSSGPGTVDDYERWLETERVETTYNYDPDTAYLTDTVTEIYGWYTLRVAAAEKVFNSPDWEWDYEASRAVFHSLDAVEHTFGGLAIEQFRVVARETEEFDVSDGFVTAERFTREETFARPGNTYLYNGGGEAQDAIEALRVSSSTFTFYTAAGEQNAVKITAEQNHAGVTQRIVVEDLETYLPAAQRRSAVRPDPALYPNGMTASRNEHQELEFKINSRKLEANRPNWTHRLSDQYIEDIEEAEARGRFELARRSAIPYAWTIPGNPMLEPGSQVTLNLLPTREVKAHVQRMTIEPKTDGGSLGFVTVAEGVLYVV